MKKTFVILLISLLSAPVFSQIFTFGIKAGAESAVTPKYNVSSGTTNIEAMKDASWGFNGGVFFRIKLPVMYVQPEIIFASTSFDYRVTEPVVSEVKSQQFNHLSIPILLGAKLGPLRANIGPTASIRISSPKALIDHPDFGNMYKGALWGFQTGIGVDLFKKLTLDVRYAGGFGDKYGDSVTIGNQNYKLEHGLKSFLISAGFMF